MPLSRSARRVSALASTLVLVLAACGSGSKTHPSTKAGVSPPVSFPKPNGRNLAKLIRGLPTGPKLAPSISMLTPGRNRFGFALFDRANKQLEGAAAAVYLTRLRGSRPVGPALGPYPSHWESFAVKRQFVSKTTATDPDAAKGLYVAQVELPRRQGKYAALAIANLDDRLVVAQAAPVPVVKRPPFPLPGKRPPLIHTPTTASVHGDVSKIDTRNPPDDMHYVDFARVFGKRPIVLLFATPALCQSRTCGPVVDIAQQVKAERARDAAFIHMEIYKDNQVQKGPRPQFEKWHLPSEPFLFTLDRRGRVAAAIQGPFSAAELEHALNLALHR